MANRICKKTGIETKTLSVHFNMSGISKEVWEWLELNKNTHVADDVAGIIRTRSRNELALSLIAIGYKVLKEDKMFQKLKDL